jgi:hypothetical protein
MKFQVGQRVIAKPDKLLGGYYGHVVEIDSLPPYFVIVQVMGRTVNSTDRHLKEIGRTFPFHDGELEAAD